MTQYDSISTLQSPYQLHTQQSQLIQPPWGIYVDVYTFLSPFYLSYASPSHRTAQEKRLAHLIAELNKSCVNLVAELNWSTKFNLSIFKPLKDLAKTNGYHKLVYDDGIITFKTVCKC